MSKELNYKDIKYFVFEKGLRGKGYTSIIVESNVNADENDGKWFAVCLVKNELADTLKIGDFVVMGRSRNDYTRTDTKPWYIKSKKVESL